ncbi:MAG: hypothetical protein ACW99G_03065 [Candidatus Thorarchaeota archaeon]|jgi:hypothetical protein
MKWILVACLLLFTTGCNISPLSPELRNDIDNQQGEIDEIKNNQNGFMLDFMKFKNEQDQHARDVENQIQGMFNSSNSGVQILQGDGALILIFGIATMAMLFVYHYKTQAGKSQKAAEIMAQQIAIFDDGNLDNSVFLSAMDTDAEEDIYRMMVKAQSYTGRTRY